MNIQSFSEHCCGCGECSQVCPVNAIQMVRNDQGFLYPKVDQQKCINCSICSKACSFNKPLQRKPDKQVAYVVKHKEEDIRAEARSGGIFTSISDVILDRGGVIYGCRFAGTRDAVHCRATTKKERDLFHGSKYIQSRIIDCYQAVKDDLLDGKWVLFSGTACQISAIYDFCKNVDRSKLLLIDIVCHGVPSNQAWQDYITWVEEKTGKKVIAADFRDKKNFGWTAHVETFTLEDGSSFSCDYHKELFYAHYILREDCFQCLYKNLNRQGDITLADCWGIAEQEPDFHDDKGVSLVLLNTNLGKEMFHQVEETIDYRPADIEKYLQQPLKGNWEKPAKYEEFWKDYQQNGFKDTYQRYMCPGSKTPESKGEKKIGILTFHFPHNCGAVLQAYALSKTIEKFGKCEVLNYQPDYHASWENYRYHYEYPPTRLRAIWHGNRNKIRGLLSMTIHFPGIMMNKKYRLERKRTKTFEDFMENHLPMSPKLHWPNEVKEYAKNYDAVVAGSDQVWNPRIFGGGLDEIYLLPFDTNIRKYSYAASAGGDWDDRDVTKIGFYLGNFDDVSVREPDLLKALQGKNVSGRVDVDPSLLLEKEEYFPLEKSIKSKREFVFIYVFQVTEELIEVLQELHRRWDCDFISYPLKGELNSMVDFEVQELNPLGPAEFLWLMHHAKYVVTATFHGLAYATIYEKPFVCLKPEHSKTRIDNYLSMFGLEDHFYQSVDRLVYNTDYTEFRKRVEIHRREAIRYIKEICEK